MKTLVIGFGNPLRSDDGAGPTIAGLIGDRNFPGIETRVVHQLHVDLLEDWKNFDRVLLIDAGVEGPPVSLKRVLKSAEPESSTHHMAPATLLSIFENLYGKPPLVWLLTVQGASYDVGDSLSPAVQQQIPAALALAEKWIMETENYA